MNHVDINGFIVSSEDEMKVTPPTAKGGLKPAPNTKKSLDKYGLDIATAYFEQAISNIRKAQQIISAVSDDLKVVD